MSYFKVEDILIDLYNSKIFYDLDKSIKIKEPERKLLECFLKNPKTLIKKDYLLNDVLHTTLNGLYSTKSKLVKLLKDVIPGKKLILTHSRDGYEFDAEVELVKKKIDTPLTTSTLKQYLSESNFSETEKRFSINSYKELVFRKTNKFISPDGAYNIYVSRDNPFKPEFPPEPYFRPRFPASLTKSVEIEGFKHVYIKDESTNPTGTHKDRMAWEIVLSLLESKENEGFLPELSFISAGSAACAIQFYMNVFGIDKNLRTIVDLNTKPIIIEQLEELGCKTYKYDLSSKLLGPDEIKLITNNTNGIDLTYRLMDPDKQRYYDWLSFEVFNEEPEYCFVPFGTGELYFNLIKVLVNEVVNIPIRKRDPRMLKDVMKLKKCSFFGAYGTEETPKFDKLYAKYLPKKSRMNAEVDFYINQRYIGDESQIVATTEKNLNEAIDICRRNKINYEPSGLGGLCLFLDMKHELNPERKVLIINTGKTNYEPKVEFDITGIRLL